MIKRLLNIFRKEKENIYTEKNVQSIEFTDTTENILNTLIGSEDNKNKVVQELRKYCVYTKTHMDGCSERLIFAILKISTRSGSFQKADFQEAIDLAMYDYRDLLIASGFGNDIYIHNDWAKEILEENESRDVSV